MQTSEAVGSPLTHSQPYRTRVATVGTSGASAAREPISAPTMRRSNAVSVLDALRRMGTATRTDLAHATGLTMPTVHRAMAELEEMGLIHQQDGPPPSPGSGRRPTWYAFERSIAATAGIDVGNETARAALALADGTIVSSTSVPTADIAPDLDAGLVALIERLCASTSALAGPLVGVGVGVSGTVHPATGTIGRAAQHRTWDGLPLREALRSRLGCPVVVEQDDHLAALAEISEHGGAPGASTVVVVNIGKGIGVGLIAEGRMLRGAHGAAGRLAHWPLQGYGPDGLVVGNILVADALAHMYTLRGGARPVANGLDLCNAARSGDAVAAAVVADVATALGDMFLRLAAVFDPEIMILGGGLANSFDLFAPSIRRALDSLPNAVPLVPSPLGADAVVLGSLIAGGRFVERWIEAQIPVDR